jgi:transcriptional regulator with GAF, ATPase, and Fis domain
MNVSSLQKVALALAESQTLDSVLQLIVRGLAEQSDVALARVWLKRPGDICATCSMKTSCPDQDVCLHLAASAGNALDSQKPAALNDYTRIDGHYSRVPLNGRLKVGHVGGTGQAVLLQIQEEADKDKKDWIDRSDWVEAQMICSFAGQPLIFKGEVLGVLGLFSRAQITEGEFTWLRAFADSAALSIANARASEEIRQSAGDLQLQIEVLQSIPATAWTVTSDGQLDFVNRFYLDVMGQSLEACLAPLAVWNKGGSDLPPFLTGLHPDHKESVRKIFWDGIRSGRGWTFEAPFLHSSDGKYHWHLDRAVPLRDKQGKVVRFVGTCADIDELKQAERKNMKAYQEIAALKARLERENTYFQEEIRKEHNFEEIVGNSPELLKLLDNVESAAPTNANVLILGETGSGKELIARAIHSRSARKQRPLVKVNCGAMPAGLVESELFGHVKGAFTGASQTRVGRFELADGGTLFLDEVGELPLETQVKLLRVLQEQQFEPVGSNRTIRVDVRIIAATNRDLAKAVQSGQFRSDLYYRLNVIPLRVPALRERRSDIPELVRFFLEHSSKRIGKAMQAVSQESMKLLVDYPWPGNIRELQNIIERGVVLSRSSALRLGPDLLPVEGFDNSAVGESENTPEPDSSASLEDVERQHILQVLDKTGWLISGPNGAGAILKLHPNTLRSRMKRLGIQRSSHAIS